MRWNNGKPLPVYKMQKHAMQHIYIYVLARKNVTRQDFVAIWLLKRLYSSDSWPYQSSPQTDILRYNNILIKE